MKIIYTNRKVVNSLTLFNFLAACFELSILSSIPACQLVKFKLNSDPLPHQNLAELLKAGVGLHQYLVQLLVPGLQLAGAGVFPLDYFFINIPFFWFPLWKDSRPCFLNNVALDKSFLPMLKDRHSRRLYVLKMSL